MTVVERRALDAAGCVGVEPALAGAGDTRVGDFYCPGDESGDFYCPGDESGDAYTFTARLANIRARAGVAFRHGTTAARLRADGDRVTGASGGMMAVRC